VRDGRRLIVVVLGGPSRVSRDQNAADLLYTGFDVMNRRANGERITVAQNMFEGEQPIGPVVRDGVAQGDEAGADRIVLASAKPMGRASKIEIVEPAKRGGKGDLKKAETWGIQVGAFRAKSDAKEQIALIEKRFDKHVDDAKAFTAKAGRKYQARFSGMSEYEAKQACKAIKAKRMACAVVRS
jgi:D-alanyl-D-alanine carboxypeptidase (penicillin-binding protein 5/6)